LRFQIVSHAGLSVTSADATLLFDPWLIGSCYWRWWWNYPPVDRALITTLRPDYIYLTHIHWDHFQGPSLRLFPKGIPIIVPKGHHDRIKRDLEAMGFWNVKELRHGETIRLGKDFRLTSYSLMPNLDSAAICEVEGVTLLNANDAKFMGGPLEEILSNHSNIDFVFRSHSSANGRLCYEVVDEPLAKVDDDASYASSFIAFARATGARFAIPFASNHCFLHKDVYALNSTITTPLEVEEHYLEAQRRLGASASFPEIKIMVSGDSWSTDSGFEISPETRNWFVERDFRLAEYLAREQSTLDRFYEKENNSRLSSAQIEKYFKALRRAVPAPVRMLFRNTPLTLCLSAGSRVERFQVDIYRGTVSTIDAEHASEEPFEIHTTQFIFKQCMALDLFSHLPISKRVHYRVSRRTRKLMQLLNGIWILYETDLLPGRHVMPRRIFETWCLRWRELALYAQIGKDLLLGRGFNQQSYLSPREPLPTNLPTWDRANAK